MWTQAIEDAIEKTRRNIRTFGHHFPHVSDQGKYVLNPNDEWTDGFWSGILWLCYEYTKDETFREAARKTTDSFRHRLDYKLALEHHDIGFLYSLSAKAQWIVERDESARKLAIEAAVKLLERWREKSGIIQAWGPIGDAQQGGRMIIDCLMNLPLLYWAAEQTGDERFHSVALMHAEKSLRYLVRGDDSSYHTFYFEQETGIPVGGATHQGYHNGSTWTRGQAWGVYGFALSYRKTGKVEFLEASKRLALYFLRHLPKDSVAYWDFDVPIQTNPYRDSSASAIVAAGLQELLSLLPEADADRMLLEEGLMNSVQSLVNHYATIGEGSAEGFLKHGSYHVRGNSAPDDFMIWGDYYYLEALMRLERGLKGYWYE